MSINFKTQDPYKLLAAFKKAIDDKHVVTWSYDASGDFTHTPPQWINKAWLRPVVYQGQLTFNLLGNKTEITTWEFYGIYHGRFIESMIIHCHSLFETASATATPTNSDIVTSKVA